MLPSCTPVSSKSIHWWIALSLSKRFFPTLLLPITATNSGCSEFKALSRIFCSSFRPNEDFFSSIFCFILTEYTTKKRNKQQISRFILPNPGGLERIIEDFLVDSHRKSVKNRSIPTQMIPSTPPHRYTNLPTIEYNLHGLIGKSFLNRGMMEKQDQARMKPLHLLVFVENLHKQTFIQNICVFFCQQDLTISWLAYALFD